MTLTEARDSTVYDATMEASLAAFEESVFLNIAATRSTEEAFEGTASAKLGPESIGPAKMLVVSPGDTINMEVYAKFSGSFSSTSDGNTAAIGAALAAVFGVNGGAATVYEQNTYNVLNNGASSFLASARYPGSSNVPKAYLNYVFFDQDFNVILTQSGYKKVETSSSGAFDKIEIPDKVVQQAGYLYVYLSNEGRTTDGGNVYFDALRVNHKKGHILQEDHYYPFGLTINALSSNAPLSKPNKFKYNGKELNTEFGLDWYHYGARMYDPVLGRFPAIDPLADKYKFQTPYAYAVNNPIRWIDVNGEGPGVPFHPSRGMGNVVESFRQVFRDVGGVIDNALWFKRNPKASVPSKEVEFKKGPIKAKARRSLDVTSTETIGTNIRGFFSNLNNGPGGPLIVTKKSVVDVKDVNTLDLSASIYGLELKVRNQESTSLITGKTTKTGKVGLGLGPVSIFISKTTTADEIKQDIGLQFSESTDVGKTTFTNTLQIGSTISRESNEENEDEDKEQK